MKELLYTLAGLVLIVLLTFVIAVNYFNNGEREPTNKVWQSYIGRDTTVGILPDKYANYFTYTAVRTNNNIGFRVKGEFPDTRYFSFNVYSVGDNITQGSLVDYQIETDSGLPNPFLVNQDSIRAGWNFTVHVVPTKFQQNELGNSLPFRDDVRVLLIVMRLYDYNVDDFGGVAFPTIEAISFEEKADELVISNEKLPRPLDLRGIVRKRSLPGMVKRLGLLYNTEKTVKPDGAKSDDWYTIPFHAVDTKGYIENNDNRYLLSAITKSDDEVYVFRFKAPSFTTGPENINQTDVRYWSFNLGNAATYNFNALKDEDAILDQDGYVNILLASKDEALEARAKELGYNFLEWNMPWQKGLILFRHMLADPDFEVQIDDVPPVLETTEEYTEIEAQHYLGDYAPQGVRMSKEDFLESYTAQAVAE